MRNSVLAPWIPPHLQELEVEASWLERSNMPMATERKNPSKKETHACEVVTSFTQGLTTDWSTLEKQHNVEICNPWPNYHPVLFQKLISLRLYLRKSFKLQQPYMTVGSSIQHTCTKRFRISTQLDSIQLILNPTELNLCEVGHGRELNKNPIFMMVNRVC